MAVMTLCNSFVGVCRLGIVLILWAMFFGGCSIFSPAPELVLIEGEQRRDLDGEWKIHTADYFSASLYRSDVDDEDWPTIAVPANWYLQGIDQAGGSFWYRRTFTVSPSWRQKIVRLGFEGVDYTADVWLNDSYLGFHEGYFGPFSFDVTDVLDFKGENTLAVLVKSPMEEPERVWSLNKRQIKGVLNHHDTRPGGAWSAQGQDKNSGGIWAPVYLEASEQVRITSLKIRPAFLAPFDSASAEVDMTVECTDNSDKNLCQGVSVDVLLEPHNFSGNNTSSVRHVEKLHLAPGTNDVHFSLQVAAPRLWWPWEMGNPHLYRLTAHIKDTNRNLDSHSEVFGFRSVVNDPQTGVWTINGKRLFLRGTNYIGSIWLSELSSERLREDLEQMRKAYINAIRVHAHITAPSFYSLCDEMGLLIWQDFPLQWGYEESEAFTREAQRQASEMIELLFNHPSIIVWCGHNEPPWDASWMKYRYPRYDAGQNKTLDEALYHHMRSLDSSRYVHKHSATSEHPWLGWYSGSWLDYGKPVQYPLITEFGAQALPDLSTLQTIIPLADLWPQNDQQWNSWKYHNFQPHETFTLAGVEKGDNINEFIANSQHYQARLTKYAAESYRRQRYAPVTAIFQFMFTEHWPSLNWGVVDYLRKPKPGYFALQSAYQPLLPSAEFEKFTWQPGEIVTARVWLVNDLHEAQHNLLLRLHLRTAFGQSVATRQLSTAVGADSAQLIGEQKWPKLAVGEYILGLEIFDNGGEKRAENSYSFNVVESP